MENSYVLVTDRGGHLHNALMLVQQMPAAPQAIVTTYGPDIDVLKKEAVPVHCVPHLFKWFGKLRIINPFSFVSHLIVSLWLAIRLRPKRVISLGASNVVPFCYWAKLLGAEIIHVECMNQVRNPSITGKLLYPICGKLYVQWEELLSSYGSKAVYEGWVL